MSSYCAMLWLYRNPIVDWQCKWTKCFFMILISLHLIGNIFLTHALLGSHLCFPLSSFVGFGFTLSRISSWKLLFADDIVVVLLHGTSTGRNSHFSFHWKPSGAKHRQAPVSSIKCSNVLQFRMGDIGKDN